MSQTNTVTETNEGRTPLLPLLLLGAIVGVLPLLVYMQLVTFDGIAGEIYGPSLQGNLFSYIKTVWLYILTAAAMWWFRCNRQARPNWYHQPLVVYSFLVIVSTIFAEHRQMALWGDPHRHEGMFAHLCYMAIVYLIINLINSDYEIKFLTTALLLSATLLSLLGVAQFFGYDYLYSDWAESLFVAKHIHKLLPGIDFKQMQNNAHSIFLTFGNGNFTGSYMAMVLAFTLPLSLLWKSRGRWLLIALDLLLLVNLLGSKSRAGLLGLVVATFFAALLLRRIIRANMRLTALILACCLLTPFAMDAFTWKTKNLPRFLETSVGRSVSVKTSIFGNFEDLKIASDTATFVFDGVQTEVRLVDEKIEFYDHKGELVPYRLLPNPKLRIDSEKIVASYTPGVTAKSLFAHVTRAAATEIAGQLQATSPADVAIASDTFFQSKQYLLLFPEKKLRGFLIYAWPQHNVLEIGRGGVSFHLVAVNGVFKFLNQFGRPVDIQPVETFGFANHLRFASNRGYIWSRTLPLLKDTLFIGFGPDTFAAHFPNHDYLGKLKVWGSGVYTMIEKPHNLFLQIAINSGLISLAAILALLGAYFYESFKLYRNSGFNTFSESVGVSACAAVIAYLVAGIFNDSIAGIAPVFWSILGLGIATNQIVKAR